MNILAVFGFLMIFLIGLVINGIANVTTMGAVMYYAGGVMLLVGLGGTIWGIVTK